MRKIYILLSILFASFIMGQNDYSLEDINSNSEFFGEDVGTSYFQGEVTLHYFGHYN